MFDRFFCLGAGIAVGATASFVALPSPSIDNECLVHTVERRPVVSYVMKPPYQEPVVLRQDCPAPESRTPVVTDSQKLSDGKTETIEPVEEKPRRHKRHHRARGHWR